MQPGSSSSGSAVPSTPTGFAADTCRLNARAENMSWELPLLTTLIVSVLGFLWLRSGNFHLGFSTVLLARFGLAIGAAIISEPHKWLRFVKNPNLETLHDLPVNVVFAKTFKMVLTLGAVVWLLNRSWQTLWQPVPDLINILGVDVPEPPDVCLAGIRADAATLSWTRPAPNRPVQRYLIHVNGIHGLKPNHFYNIRVVAMGPNNFQAGSEVVRLRTFGKDGKPYLGNSRTPTSFIDDDQSRPRSGDDSDSTDAPYASFAAAVEAAPVLDGNSTTVRDTGPSNSGQRRNTLNRRHSPSVTSGDRPVLKSSETDGPEPSLDELNRRFQTIRREIIDISAQHAKEEADHRQNEEDLEKKKESKRLMLKEKEERTAQLRTQVRTTMEQMRSAEKERAKKEQQLKNMENKKSKVRDSIAKLEKDTERMKETREDYVAQKATLQKKTDCKVSALDEDIAKLQDEHNDLEAELSNKGKLLNEMKEERMHLPGADDDQLKESDERIRREWDQTRSQLHASLVEEAKIGHQLDTHYLSLVEQLSHQAGPAYYPSAETSGVEIDPSRPDQPKRTSYHSTHGDIQTSPLEQFSEVDAGPHFPSALPLAQFARGPYIPESANSPQTEEELRAAGGPLSPMAETLLPSGIIDADFEGSDTRQQSSLLPESITMGEDGPQSPASSSPSFSAFSSPQDSSQNLAFPTYVDSSDRSSLNQTKAPAAGLRLSNLLSHRDRAKKGQAVDEKSGPPIGSLRTWQSQSFPRETDDHDAPEARRRMSFSFKNHRNSATAVEEGPSYVLGGKALKSSLNRVTNSAFTMFGERDPDHSQLSRPASIASSDLPRPSTDSGSIWAPGEGLGLVKQRLWPATDRWPSRSGSRRPSLHGSPANLTTTLASADDEILYETELQDPQTSASNVGVIGSRPPGSSKSMTIGQRLNPNAPTFKGFFRKDKDKDRGKDKTSEPKGKGKEVATPTLDISLAMDESPSDSRLSRDTFSVHTQTSDSHDSLPLDISSSNPQLEASTGQASIHSRDADNVNGIRKLLRKGSSGKFSLSRGLGKESSIFKKGPGSATNSDRNTSADHRSSIGDLDEFDDDPGLIARSYDSVNSSPSLGPAKSKESKESRISNWRFMKKKGKETPSKEKESLEMDRALVEE